MKKFAITLLNILLILNILVLVVSYTFKDIFINGILMETIKTKINQVEYKEPNQTIKDVITEEGVITNNELVNEILQSKEIQDLINQYMNQVIDQLLDENQEPIEFDPLELEKDMMNYIKQNKIVLEEKTGIEITDELVEETFLKINQEDLKKATLQKMENTKKNLSIKEKMFLRLYKILISKKIKILLWILLGINIIIRIIMEKSWVTWIKVVSNLSIISGILSIALSLGIKKIIVSILGNINIQTTPLSRVGLYLIIGGFVTFLTYKFVSVLIGGKNEVSQVSNE